MSWIRAFLELNKSLCLKGLLLLMAFLLGLQMGQSRLQSRWDAEKRIVQIAQAKQEQHAADVAHAQNQISKEISDEYRKKSSLLASRSVALNPKRVHNNSEINSDGLPSASSNSWGFVSGAANDVPVATSDAGEPVGCSQLALDAMHTTLLLMEIQRWYERVQGAGM